MGSVGGEATVKCSSGSYSRKYINQTGFAVRCLSGAGKRYWVLRFPSTVSLMEEGLFEDSELNWIS